MPSLSPEQTGQIIMFTTPTCGDCRTTKLFMDMNNIPYHEVDITEPEHESDTAFVETVNGGYRSVPLLLLFDHGVIGEQRDGYERHLTEPTFPALREALLALGLMNLPVEA